MPSCVVKSCKNYMSKLRKTEGITYHMFPRLLSTKDEWIQIIRNCRGQDDWNPSSASTVCSVHFDDADFRITAKGYRCLVPYAIPKKLLCNPQKKTKKTSSSMIMQVSTNDKSKANDRMPSPSRSTNSPLKFEFISNLQMKTEPTSSSSIVIQASPNDKSGVNDHPPPSPSQSTNSPSTFELLSDLEIKTETTQCSPIIMQASPNDKSGENDQPPSPSLSMNSPLTFEVPALIKKEFIEYCRLCATSNCDAKLISLQSDDAMKELVVNMLKRLNTDIDFNLQGPSTSICSACVKALYTAYDFVVGIDLAQKTIATVHLDPLATVSPNNDPAGNELQETSLPESSIPFFFESPLVQKLSRELCKKKRIIVCQSKNSKALTQKVRRFQTRIESLRKIVQNLKKRNYIDEDLFKTHVVAADLFDILNRKKLKKVITYSLALKQFCLTLTKYSPQAFDYIRESFGNCLPHRKSLCRWRRHNTDDIEFTEESLEELEAEESTH